MLAGWLAGWLALWPAAGAWRLDSSTSDRILPERLLACVLSLSLRYAGKRREAERGFTGTALTGLVPAAAAAATAGGPEAGEGEGEGIDMDAELAAEDGGDAEMAG